MKAKLAVLVVLILGMAQVLLGQTVIVPVAGVATIDPSVCLNNLVAPCAFSITLTANTTLNLINARGSVDIFITENSVGGWTFTFPSTVTSPPVIVTTAGLTTLVSLKYNNSVGQWFVTSGSGGLAPSVPLPLATSGPGPVFNVMNYGAKGNARANTGNFINGNPQFTCATCNFTQADVGLTIFAQNVLVQTTILSVQNGTTATVTAAPIATNAAAPFGYGTIDDVPVKAAIAAALPKACVLGGQRTANTCIPGASPAVYFPAGGYLICNFGGTNGLINIGAVKGFQVFGDGKDVTFIHSCLAPTTPSTNFGAFMTVASGADSIVLRDLTINGNFAVFSNNAVLIGSSSTVSHVHIENWSGPGISFQGGPLDLVEYLTVDNSGINAISVSNATGVDFYSSTSSNNGCPNLVIQTSLGLNTGSGVKWYGGLIDECGLGDNNSVDIINSQDVWFIGASVFSTGAGNAISVSGSGGNFLHLDGGIFGVFGNDFNAGGLAIAAGSVVQASDVRFASTGTAKCIANSGILNDNGGNSCESEFPIASGTSTGTTAVLTLTTLGANVNTNCSVGDALLVEGAGAPAGYNGYYPAGATSGITAVTATTLTYTTAGSNLGAAGAAGVAICRNLQNYSGTLPRALLNNPIPNTCYVTITPIVNATTYTMCNFRAQSATNITRIMASSQVTTTCATAPIITISDGTVSETLTLTTAKSSWDSAVDTSTGVGTTIFKPNGTITVKYDVAAASACATPPTQLSVSYNISPILSN